MELGAQGTQGLPGTVAEWTELHRESGDTQRGPCSFQPSSGWYMLVREVGCPRAGKKLHKGLEGTIPRADRRPKFVRVPVFFFFFVSQSGKPRNSWGIGTQKGFASIV